MTSDSSSSNDTCISSPNENVEQDQLYRCVGTLSETSMERIEHIRDEILSDAPDKMSASNMNSISFHTGFLMPPETSDEEDMVEELKQDTMKLVSQHTSETLTPKSIEVTPGGRLVNAVVLTFEEHLHSIRMRQAATIERHGGESISYPVNTAIVLACADDDSDVFQRVMDDDPDGIVDWGQNFDPAEYEELLPKVMEVVDSSVEKTEL